jgi:putative DNA primase/helicase
MMSSKYGTRPTLQKPGDLYEVTDRAFDALMGWRSDTDWRKFIARLGTETVWLEPKEDGSGHLQITVLEANHMRHLMARVAQWANGDKLISPPMDVVANMLVEPRSPLPQVERLTDVPVIAPDGSVHMESGYNAASRCFYTPAEDVHVPSVPSVPSAQDVTDARDLLYELLADFPFTSDAERAHAIAFMILPFVRILIKGPTPIHLFEAPNAGTGKSLIVEVLAIPTLGPRAVAFMAEGEHGDEWRKRITAALRHAPPFFVIDNISRTLDSGALASMVTAGVIEDRILQTSNLATIPIRCAIAVTGNNPTLSKEMIRRSVRIRINREGVEKPEDYVPPGGWKHANLREWTKQNRGELVWAVLTLARAWVAEGRPGPGNLHLGSFEQWTHVIGGILRVAGIPGFLDNLHEFRAAVEDTADADLVRALFDKFNTGTFPSRVAYEECGSNTTVKDVHGMAMTLTALVDRPLGGYVLRRGKHSSHTGGRLWSIEMAEVAG